MKKVLILLLTILFLMSGAACSGGQGGTNVNYGRNTPEKFTAEVRYAVTDDGRILVYDLPSNEYKEYEAP